MIPRLLPALLAALLTGCHESQPPPQSLRLRISPFERPVANAFSVDDPAFPDWLREEIVSGRIHQDVRLDFACDVPLLRMAETINAVANAGAGSPDYSVGFCVDGWIGDDFQCSFPPVETCCIEVWTSGADDLGEFTITESPGPRVVDFCLRFSAGAVRTEYAQLDTGRLKELFLDRRRRGPVRVTLHADSEAIASDLLPVLTMCHAYGAQFYFAPDETPSRKSKLLHHTPSAQLLTMGHHSPGGVAAPGVTWPQPHPWIPAHERMGASSFNFGRALQE
jgi:hypothetical protein